MSSFKKHSSGYNLRSHRCLKGSLVQPPIPEHAKDSPDFSPIPEPSKKRRRKINFSSQPSDLNDPRGIRTNNDLKNENILLREELRAVHKSASQDCERMIASHERTNRRQIDREARSSETHRSEIISYREAEYHLNADIADLREEVDNLSSELLVTRESLTDHMVSKEEWIGRTLKFQYLFQQIEKIGLKQSEDIFDAFQDIEVPEVSIRIKDKFVPTSQTDNIDWSEDIENSDDWSEPDIIGEDQTIPSTLEMYQLPQLDDPETRVEIMIVAAGSSVTR